MKASSYLSAGERAGSYLRFSRVRPGLLLRLIVMAWAGAVLPLASTAADNIATPKPPLMDPTKPAFPGILTNPDPTKPPPFVELPHDPVPPSTAVDAATAAISPAVRAKVEADHAAWRTADGGAEFFPGLTYLRGHPIVMLITSKQETAALKGRRQRAVVTAFEFLLAEAAFERATVCIVAQEGRDPSPSVRNHVVRREQFEMAAKSTAQAASVKAAVNKARAETATAQQICAALGID